MDKPEDEVLDPKIPVEKTAVGVGTTFTPDSLIPELLDLDPLPTSWKQTAKPASPKAKDLQYECNGCKNSYSKNLSKKVCEQSHRMARKQATALNPERKVPKSAKTRKRGGKRTTANDKSCENPGPAKKAKLKAAKGNCSNSRSSFSVN